MDEVEQIEMEKSILLISEMDYLLLHSVENQLRQGGYEVTMVSPDASAIRSMEHKPSIFLVYLESYQQGMADTLSYLKEYIDEMGAGVLLYLMGTLEELGKAHEVFPVVMETGEFERPCSGGRILEQIDQDVEKDRPVEEKRSILVVDDDGTMLRMLKLWLSDKYQVYMANSGANAIALLAKKQVDLILLDYEMPVLPGPKVLEMIRSEEQFAHIPVMFLTGKDDRESVLSVLAMKPEAYLLKNQPPEDLLAAIDGFFLNC